MKQAIDEPKHKYTFKAFVAFVIFLCLFPTFCVLGLGQLELLKVVPAIGAVLPKQFDDSLNEGDSTIAVATMMTLCYAYTFGAKYYFPLKEPQTISIDRLVRERYGTNAIEPWRETPVTKSKKVKDFDRLVHGLSQRRECLCNIDRIYSAMERYYDEHNTAVPFCTYDEDGNVLHSWRVLLLPYLGYKELYDKIRLDEPWDSEWNKRFHDIAPMCYCCPACREPATAANAYDKACYSAVTVPDAIATSKQSAALSTDAKRLIVVERRPLYNWMDPEHELQCDELKELLSDPTDRGNHVDGSVWAIGAEAPYEIGTEPLGKFNDFVTPDVLFKELSCER